MYTKFDFANRIRGEVLCGYNAQKIARIAYGEFLDHCNNLESGLQTEIMKVVVMEEGPEFEMTEQEILGFLDDLLER